MQKSYQGDSQRHQYEVTTEETPSKQHQLHHDFRAYIEWVLMIEQHKQHGTLPSSSSSSFSYSTLGSFLENFIEWRRHKSGHSVDETLTDLQHQFGRDPATLFRQLTKLMDSQWEVDSMHAEMWKHAQTSSRWNDVLWPYLASLSPPLDAESSSSSSSSGVHFSKQCFSDSDCDHNLQEECIQEVCTRVRRFTARKPFSRFGSSTHSTNSAHRTFATSSDALEFSKNRVIASIDRSVQRVVERVRKNSHLYRTHSDALTDDTTFSHQVTMRILRNSRGISEKQRHQWIGTLEGLRQEMMRNGIYFTNE